MANDDFDDSSFLDTRPDPPPPRKRRELPLWVVHMTDKPVGAAKGHQSGFVCFGCFDAGNFLECSGLDEIRTTVDQAYPDAKETMRMRWAEDVNRIVFQVEDGDLLVHPIDKEDEIMIGVFEGGYARLENDYALIDEDSAQVRRVRWIETVPRSAFTKEAQRSFGSQFMIHSSAGYRDEVVAILKARGHELI